MKLTDKQIEDFRSIYQASFGVELDCDDALEAGISLTRLMQIVYRPITEQQYKSMKENEYEQQVISRSTENQRAL